jgi:bifunctional non-homologous end joining protein LigD
VLSRVFSDGQALFAAAKANGLEGVMGKNRFSTYEPGRRSRSWLKIKVPNAWKGHNWS